MEDAEASLYVGGDVTMPPAAASAADVGVHTLTLGMDDDDDLLRRHAIADANDSTATEDHDDHVSVTGVGVNDTPLAPQDVLSEPLPTGPSAHPPASMSAVYRFYEIEATLSLKRREESSIAKCRLCKSEGRQERKGCVRFSKSVTSNLWRHLKENHPDVYEKHVGEKKTIQMHKLVSASKRGRKKKPVATPPTPGVASGAVVTTDEQENEQRFLDDVDDAGASGNSDSAPRKPVKRARRQQSPVNDQFFTDYALSMSAAAQGGHSTLAAALEVGLEKRPIHLDRVREAAAFLCVHELVPFELCSSLAFRHLLTECQVGATLVEDATALATAFGKQALVLQSKKLVEEVKDRVVAQLKAVDGVHLQVVEWTAAAHGEQVSQTQIVGMFAVSLDQEFNIVRRCLCAVPIEQTVDSPGETVAVQLERAEAFKRAIKIIAPHKHVPNLAVVEPSRRSHFATVLLSNKLEVLESITSLLRDIMVSTITGASFTHPFMVGSEFSTEDVSPGSFQRVFDTTRFVETTDDGDAPPAELLDAELPSSILTELPNVLTGHTIRDILLKVLHVVAHIKASKETRRVMREIMVTEFELEGEAFAQIFEIGPSSVTVVVRSIHEVLALTLKMMPTLQRYFELHKDGTSDLSKLMQLASLSTYEWERVGYLSSLLKPFADAVSKLQEERYVTSSLIIPSVYTLLEKLRPTSEGGSTSELPEDMVALKHVAHAQLSATFGYLFVEPADEWSQPQRSSFNWLWSSTLLDPRTRPFIIKGALTQAQFWEVVKSEASEIAGMNKTKSKENGLSDLPDHSIALDDHDAHGADGVVNGSHTNGNAESGGDLWDDLQANLTSCAQEEMLLSSSKSALELTKSNNLLEVEISFLQDESRISLKANPLDWWQSMRVKYPYVARLARYVLSVPGSPARKENPVLKDSGLVHRLLSQMSTSDASDFIAASLNLRLEKQAQAESAPRQLWSTV